MVPALYFGRDGQNEDTTEEGKVQRERQEDKELLILSAA